jgi:hypothetical protein
MPRAPKTLTRDEAARKKQQAADFMDRLGEDDRADDFDDMSVEEYAEHRGFRLANPSRKRTTRKNEGQNTMANGLTKSDLQDQIDRATELLTDAYAPEITRENLAAAVGRALDILNGDDDDDDTDEDDDDDTDEDEEDDLDEGE